MTKGKPGSPKKTLYKKKAMRRLPIVHRASDDFMVEVGRNYDISCKKGCSHCCRQLVCTSFAEALSIVQYMHEKPSRRAIFSRLLPILREQSDMLQKGNIASGEWFDLQIDCVFLKDDTCTIYPVRPSACRTHAVINPPEACDGTAHKGDTIAKINSDEIMRYGIEQFSKMEKELGVEGGQGPLSVQLLLALVLYERGLEAYKEQIKGTMYENKVSAAVFWAEALGI